MINFRSQTAALLVRIASEAHKRSIGVAQIRVGACSLVDGLGRTREGQSKALRRELSEDHKSRVEQVQAIRDKFCRERAAVRHEHSCMGDDLRRKLAESNHALISTVAVLRLDFFSQRAASARRRRQVAGDQRIALNWDRSDRTWAVVELMHRFSRGRREMARTQKLRLTKAGRERVMEVSGLRQGFNALRGRPHSLSPNAILTAHVAAQAAVLGQSNQHAPNGFFSPSVLAAASIVASQLVVAPTRGKIVDPVAWAEKLTAMVASRIEALVRSSASVNAEFSVPVDGDTWFGQRRFSYLQSSDSYSPQGPLANLSKPGTRPTPGLDSGPKLV